MLLFHLRSQETWVPHHLAHGVSCFVTMFAEQANPFSWTGNPLSSPDRFGPKPSSRPPIGTLQFIGVSALVEHHLVHLEPGDMHPFNSLDQAFYFLLIH